MSIDEITGAIEQAGVLAVIRIRDHRTLMEACHAMVAGGVTGIEVTMSVPDPFGAIAAVEKEFGGSVLLGAGSVTDADTVLRAVDAGARYVVSPIFGREVVRAARESGAAAIAGAMSPTEAFEAQEAGASIVKIFPADIVGMAYFRAVLAPMPGLRLMPTGGVTIDNAGDWIRAGAVAVGVGSALLEKSVLANRDWAELQSNSRRLADAVSAARGEIQAKG